MVLTVDKGVALVITNKDMYMEKCMALLNDMEIEKECRDQTKCFLSKVLKQLLDPKNQFYTNSRNCTANLAFQVMTAPPLQDFMVSQKYIKQKAPSGPYYKHVELPYTD